MLKLYRRHLPDCKQKAKGRKATKCSCPIWVDGMHEGKRTRYSLDTFNWEDASLTLLELTASKDKKKDATVTEATQDFLAECEARNLSQATISKYRHIFTPLQVFCDVRAITTVRALADLETVRKFVAALPDSALSLGKKIERLRSFFQHCTDMGWCDGNPARKIKKPKVTFGPVVPFTPDQYSAILDAIQKYPTKNSFGYDNHARLYAFIYVLRYTALRISDVVSLRRDSVRDSRIFLRTLKTGAVVHVLVPEIVTDALKEIENGSPYYFWSGEGKLKSAVADWQRSLRKLFALANVTGHAHMFRHTMAVDLLEKNINVDHVAQILGNTPNIVYKHYAPWIPSRQRALDEAIKQTWS